MLAADGRNDTAASDSAHCASWRIAVPAESIAALAQREADEKAAAAAGASAPEPQGAAVRVITGADVVERGFAHNHPRCPVCGVLARPCALQPPPLRRCSRI
jgi:hypothetical protein